MLLAWRAWSGTVQNCSRYLTPTQPLPPPQGPLLPTPHTPLYPPHRVHSPYPPHSPLPPHIQPLATPHTPLPPSHTLPHTQLTATETMNYDDAFTLEGVSEDLVDKFNHVAGILPVLTTHIHKVGHYDS